MLINTSIILHIVLKKGIQKYEGTTKLLDAGCRLLNTDCHCWSGAQVFITFKKSRRDEIIIERWVSFAGNSNGVT